MEGYIGEIRMFAGNFNPRNWAFCQGQLLAISTNTALFSILGTTYGGNGATTFALPDFRGRIGRGVGQGPGLSNISLGEQSGQVSRTLITSEMPAHTHTMSVAPAATHGGWSDSPGNSNSPVGRYHAIVPGTNAYSTTADTQLAPYNISMGNTGGSQPFTTQPPYLALNFIICLQGIFPSRN
jgi:microcystin-dependent protein